MQIGLKLNITICVYEQLDVLSDFNYMFSQSYPFSSFFITLSMFIIHD